MIRVSFFAAIFILMTNHVRGDESEETVTRESPAIGSEILEFVDEALLDGSMSGGVRTFVDGVFNYAGSLKDKKQAQVFKYPPKILNSAS